MSAMEWLNGHAAFGPRLEAEQINVISEFTLIWSFFEYRVMETEAKLCRLEPYLDEWVNAALITTSTYAQQLDYFKYRYFPDGKESERFQRLKFRKNDREEVARSVLMGTASSARDVALAVLAIVFRLRHNLFHGNKWTEGIRGQEENLKTACAALMTTVDIHRDFVQKAQSVK